MRTKCNLILPYDTEKIKRNMKKMLTRIKRYATIKTYQKIRNKNKRNKMEETV